MSEVKLPYPDFNVDIGGGIIVDAYSQMTLQEYADQRVREALAEIKELIKAIPDDELSKFDETPDFWTGALEAKCRSILIIINNLEASAKDKP